MIGIALGARVVVSLEEHVVGSIKVSVEERLFPFAINLGEVLLVPLGREPFGCMEFDQDV